MAWGKSPSSSQDELQAVLARCATSKSLTVLRSRVVLDAQGATRLAQALASPQCMLEELVISGHAIGAEGARAMGDALVQSQTSTLKRLAIGYENMGDEIVEQLLRHASLGTSLVSLDLEWRGLGEPATLALAKVLQAGHTPLTDLNLARNRLGDAGVAALASGLEASNGSLLRLSLRENEVGEAGMRALATACSRNRALRFESLDLSYNPLLPTGMAIVAPVFALDLNLDGCQGGDVGALAIASQALPRRKLHLGHNDLTAHGVRAVMDALCAATSRQSRVTEAATLTTTTTTNTLATDELGVPFFESLNLSFNAQIGHDGLAHIADAMSVMVGVDGNRSVPLVQTLDCSYVGADRVPAALLSSPCAHHIRLVGNTMTSSEACVQLVEALRHPLGRASGHLKSLALSGTELPEIAAVFAVLHGHPSLVVLEVGGFKFTEQERAALDALREANADLDIAFDR